jgi:hypothetical protein
MTARINTMNALEQAEAEEAAGVPLHKVEDEKALKVRLFGAIAWAITRREEPDLTYSDYMKRVKYAEILAFLFGSDDPEEEAEADPFPEGAAEGDEGGAAAAEGPVLSGDGDLPV